MSRWTPHLPSRPFPTPSDGVPVTIVDCNCDQALELKEQLERAHVSVAAARRELDEARELAAGQVEELRAEVRRLRTELARTIEFVGGRTP